MSGRGGRRRYQGNRNNHKNDMAVDSISENGAGPKVPFVEIRNWEAGTLNDLVLFFERKASVKLANPRQQGNVVTARINQNEVKNVERQSGARFCGGKLSVKVTYRSSAQQSPETSATVQILNAFLQSRYNPAAKLLNLSGMMTDVTIANHGLLSNPTTAIKMFQALMRLAKDNLPGVESVSLESNLLTDVELVVHVADSFPRLLNLSLGHNQISSLAPFAKLQKKLTFLRELVLAGNPLLQNPQFQMQASELVNMFPHLLILDGITVRNEADLPKSTLPMPINATFLEDESVASIVPLFLTNFFSLWDTNRGGLVALYDQASFFSMSADSGAPRLPNHKAVTSSYFALSRNLLRNPSPQARHYRIHLGPDQVSQAFKKAPSSKHDISKTGAFTIDSWKISDVRSPGDTAIMMVVHGEFEETGTRILHSFDRTLVVLPGPNMSYIVASDMLNIRGRAALPISKGDRSANGLQSQQSQEIAGLQSGQLSTMQSMQQSTQQPSNQLLTSEFGQTPQAAAVIGAGTNFGSAPSLGGMQPNGMLQEFMRQTGLSEEYATLCLKQANGDPVVALQLFQQSRAQLPLNAFSS